MTPTLPDVYLARHGETTWSLAGRHTGLTDLPLTERGEANARALGRRLAGLSFDRVFVSPLLRARRTCELAGFGGAVVDPDLLEWNYGQYEGKTSAEIEKSRPDWKLFRDGCPGGESPGDVAERADRAIDRLRSIGGTTVVFSSAHFLRVFAARWLALEPSFGASLLLGTGSLSIVSYEHTVSEPAIKLWNDTDHLLPA